MVTAGRRKIAEPNGSLALVRPAMKQEAIVKLFVCWCYANNMKQGHSVSIGLVSAIKKKYSVIFIRVLYGILMCKNEEFDVSIAVALQFVQPVVPGAEPSHKILDRRLPSQLFDSLSKTNVVDISTREEGFGILFSQNRFYSLRFDVQA